MAIAKAAPAAHQPYPTGEIAEHGDVVRIRADHLHLFDKSKQERLKDREGHIRSFSFNSGAPAVMFEAQGRRKPMLLENVSAYHYELVSRKA